MTPARTGSSPQPWLRSPIALALTLGGTLLAAAFAPGCRPDNQLAKPPLMAVEIARPVKRSVQDYLEFTGQTRARLRVELRARITGYLQSIRFKDGALVKEGDVLFQIDPAPYQAQVDLARAEVRKAEATLASQSIELQRTRALVQRTSASVQELDLRQAEANAADATVAAAKATLRNAELDLGYTEIRAPLSGRIGEHQVDVGNLVQPQTTLLATIESQDPMFVDFTMSEADLLRLERTGTAGWSTPLSQRNVPIEMGLANENGYPNQGRMDFGDLGVDPLTGTIQYRAIFPNPEGRLVSGLYARLRTKLGDPQEAILVPERAIGTGQRGDYVLIADIKGDTATIRDQPVKLGISEDGLRVVTEGLTGDEMIVVNGVQRARPGSEVSPKEVDAVQAAKTSVPARKAADAPPKAETEKARPDQEPQPPTPAPAGRPDAPPDTRPGPVRNGG
jgi:RND family efflux transporter MFP subunit